jgi:8-amino-7-oxononanoate synthase
MSAGFRARLRERGVDTGQSESQIIPVLLGDNDRATAVAAELQREGFDIRAIRPPAVAPGTARLRVAVNANLNDEILQRFADAVQRVTQCSAVSS